MRYHDEDPDRRMRLRLDLLIALMVVQLIISFGLWIDRYPKHEAAPAQQAAAPVQQARPSDAYDETGLVNTTPAQSSQPSDIRLPESVPVRAAEPPPAVQLRTRVQILNGCGKTGIAKRASDYLTKNDCEIRDVGNADRQDYRFSEIVNRGNNATAARDLAKLVGIDPAKIKKKAGAPGLDVDVTLIIGADYRRLSFGR